MSELIKREDAINAMSELQGIAQSKAELTGISKAWKRIKKLPTIDAVPVVRCGECKYWEEESTFCLNKDGCYGSETTADWFCADGKRKE